MVDRRDVGSWLEGPGAVREHIPGDYPGKDLGLPKHGPGSIATTGPRAVALIVDWALCSIIAAGLLRYSWGEPGAGSFKPLLVFILENVLLVGTLGSTMGHRLMGLRLLSVDGQPAGFVQVIVRTLLLALVLPAVIWDKDNRGFHDRIARTMLLRTR
ncbi:RDD family protein [Yimella sp. cx-573]|nr:RDD family protein [Yimella sp. cx-573]